MNRACPAILAGASLSETHGAWEPDSIAKRRGRVTLLIVSEHLERQVPISDRLLEEETTIEPSEEHTLFDIVRDKNGNVIDREEFAARFGDISEDYALSRAPDFA